MNLFKIKNKQPKKKANKLKFIHHYSDRLHQYITKKTFLKFKFSSKFDLKNIEKLKKFEFVSTELFRTNSIEFGSIRLGVRYKFVSFTVYLNEWIKLVI
jgi:hypothetical protein